MSYIATFDENRRAGGTLNPMRDKKQRHVPGGGRDGTCDHGVSRRSLRVKPILRVSLESKSDMIQKERKKVVVLTKIITECSITGGHS